MDSLQTPEVIVIDLTGFLLMVIHDCLHHNHGVRGQTTDQPGTMKCGPKECTIMGM